MTDTIPLIVSFTTLPSRISLIRPTLESLVNQTRRPDKIFLVLPQFSVRENCEYILPSFLFEFEPILEIIRTEKDYGPGTKLIGYLSSTKIKRNPSCLVVVDDDMQYKPYMLNLLYLEQITDIKSSFSFYTYNFGGYSIGQGADGFSFYTPNLEGIEAFSQQFLSPHLPIFVVDDLWISVFLALKSISVKSLQHLIPRQDPVVYIQTHTKNQLQNLKNELSRDNAMREGYNYLLNLIQK